MVSREKRREKLYVRRRPFRRPKELVLIVCEGEKTEPNYFYELKDEFKLVTVDIETAKKKDPLSIVNFAIKKAEDKAEDKDYDKLYCVFDKEDNISRQGKYREALVEIKKNKSKKYTIHAIYSIPCFEYWLLLHFIKTSRYFTAKQVVKKLKKYMPDYQKSMKNIFYITKHKLDHAIKNAKLIEEESKKAESDNYPSTKIYKLVEDLKKLK